MTNFAQMTPEEREAYAERVAVLNDRLRASPNNNLLGSSQNLVVNVR